MMAKGKILTVFHAREQDNKKFMELQALLPHCLGVCHKPGARGTLAQPCSKGTARAPRAQGHSEAGQRLDGLANERAKQTERDFAFSWCVG